MHGSLDPEENVMNDNRFTQDDLWQTMTDLGWDVRRDDIGLEIAGTQVYEIDGDGTRWKPVKGTRKYNKDAFIVIKNRSLNPTVPSQPNPELKPHHIKIAGQEVAIQQDEKAIAAELKKSDDAKGYDTYSK